MLKYSQYENHLCAERTPFSAFCLFSVHLQERYESIHSSDSWTQKVDFTLLLFLQMSHSAGLRFYFYGTGGPELDTVLQCSIMTVQWAGTITRHTGWKLLRCTVHSTIQIANEAFWQLWLLYQPNEKYFPLLAVS